MFNKMAWCAAILLAGAGVASAQAVLAERPPAYADGEGAIGVFAAANGIVFRLRQEARRRSDGEMRLYMTMEAGGRAVQKFVIDPSTWQITSYGDAGEMASVESTCSVDGLYPITDGKIYACESRIVQNGKTVDLHRELTFFISGSGRRAPCADVVEETWDERTLSRVCYSRDFKWIVSIERIKVEHSTRT